MFMPGNNGGHKVWYMKMIEDVWQPPVVASFADYSCGGPSISPDGTKIIFHAMRPTDEEPKKRDLDLWCAEKVNGEWGGQNI